MKVVLRRAEVVLALAVIASSAVAQEARDPEALFRDFCFSCHGTGWDDAPVVGDDFDWAPRREDGMEAMLQRTIEGLNAMPPNGGCGDCTTRELESIIEWMIQ